MKKLLIALLSLALVLTAFAFAEETVGMANPMVPVTDDDAFEDDLYIECDADDLNANITGMYIIDENVGQVDFTVKNGEGADVECTLRFTLDSALAESIEAFSGIYDSDMSEPAAASYEFPDDDGDDPALHMDITEVNANTEGVRIITWEYNNAYFCLTIKGELDSGRFEALLANIADATMDEPEVMVVD